MYTCVRPLNMNMYKYSTYIYIYSPLSYIHIPNILYNIFTYCKHTSIYCAYFQHVPKNCEGFLNFLPLLPSSSQLR